MAYVHSSSSHQTAGKIRFFQKKAEFVSALGVTERLEIVGSMCPKAYRTGKLMKMLLL